MKGKESIRMWSVIEEVWKEGICNELSLGSDELSFSNLVRLGQFYSTYGDAG